MVELRRHSTRARITPTSFVNEYSWGSLGADVDAWMERYFDAFLHLASWGDHVLKLRLSARLLDAATARCYCTGGHASVREKHGRVILTFASEDEDAGNWVEGAGRLASLVPARQELARGNLRALYLAWLCCVQSGDLDDAAIEPPVPAGLGELSAALESLAAFLRLDPDLVLVAAMASPRLVDSEPNSEDVRAWLATLPADDKDDVLARLIAGDTALDGAVAVLTDLRDLAERTGGTDFRRRLEALLAEHARKPALLDRLHEAGL